MNIAVLLMAGLSQRFNSQTPKQFIEINNKKVYQYCLDTFYKNKDIDYTYREKSRLVSAFNPFLDMCDMCWDKIVSFGNLIKTHPHISILYTVIICLIITIICLAVLL